jgi:hypothetical protein
MMAGGTQGALARRGAERTGSCPCRSEDGANLMDHTKLLWWATIIDGAIGYAVFIHFQRFTAPSKT